MKAILQDLALFGGQPTFDHVLHVGRPNVGSQDRVIERIRDMLDRRWLTNHGPYVHELESKIQEMLGVRNCIAMCNGTIALEITARALGLSGEVIVPAFTFVATPHALQWQEITPVFCDVDAETHNIDPEQVERMITPRTTGIVGVHVWGQPCQVEALAHIADRHNLKLMYDAAHAFCSRHDDVMIGNFGDAEVFSFHATKFFNTFEGGAVTTNDDDLAQRIRLMHNFGFAGIDNVIYIGTNGKMSEAAAAMGLTGLEEISAFVDVNYENYQAYRRELAGIEGIEMHVYDEAEQGNYQYIVLEVDEATAGISRDRLVELLQAENIRARRYFYPGCHQMEPYRSYFPHAGLLLPVTEKLVHRVMTLPTGTSLEVEDVRTICHIIRFAVEHADAIAGRPQPVK